MFHLSVEQQSFSNIFITLN